MAFEAWDGFDFDNASQDFVEESIKQGALYGIAEGFTQTRTKQELRDRGFAFGNSRFSALWNGLKFDNEGFNHFSTLNRDTLAFDDVLPQRDYFKARYRYVASFRALDEQGVPRDKITLAIDNSKRLTPRQALAQLLDVAMSHYALQGQEMDTLQLEGAIFNPNFAEL